MTSQNAVKNAKVEGIKVINPTANLLEVKVAYESLNGSRVQKIADLQVRLRRQYDPVTNRYVPEIDPDASKQIGSQDYFNPIVSVVPFTKVNGDVSELADFVIKYFNQKFVDQYQKNESKQ